MAEQQSGAGSPLAAVEAARRAHAAGDTERAGALIAAAPVDAWFGFPPHELREILDAIPAGARKGNTSLTVLSFMLGIAASSEAGPAGSVEPAERSRNETAQRIASHFRLRMGGAPRAALGRLLGMAERMRSVSSLFDSTGGVEAALSIQIGITMMLSGDYRGALSRFARVRLNAPPMLPFLVRDSYVKSALIHAQHGDRRSARVALDVAATLVRTESWAEPVIDAHAEIAEILLLPAGDAEAIARIERVPLAAVGELWPFYVSAVHAVYERAGLRREGRGRVEMLRDAAPPRRPGEGVPGSVFEMLLARDALLDGNPDAARKLIAAADRDVLGTRLVEAMIVHVTESEDRAIAMLAGLSEQTRGLRQADIARLALIASMLHASGDDRSAANALRQLAEHHGELDEIERMSLAQGVEPPTDGGDGVVRRQAGARDAGRDRALTAREHDILLTIAAGLARADGAKSLFVSLNTYKTHLRSLYRKLDARSRAEALLEATRRGLI